MEPAAASVLIIDDELEIRTFLEDLLSVHGYRCQTAESGLDGLAKMAETAPDIVLLDIMMPGLSGLEVLKMIRARDDGDPAVVMISCLTHHNTTIRATQDGADGFVMKPFRVADLLGIVDRALERRRDGVG